MQKEIINNVISLFPGIKIEKPKKSCVKCRQEIELCDEYFAKQDLLVIAERIRGRIEIEAHKLVAITDLLCEPEPDLEQLKEAIARYE